MGDWDVAYLVASCKRMRRRPTVDAGTDSDDWYALLTVAEAHWKPIIAAHYPAAMYGAPVAMTSSDNKVWTIPNVNSYPLALVVLRSETGLPLKAGPYWDAGSDYVMEGATIRVTRGRELSTTPYARVIAGPATINVSTGSAILPEQLRLLLVYHACALDAGRGGMDDPSYYEAMEETAAWGNRDIAGDVGMIGALKAQNVLVGARANMGPIQWWRPNG